MRILANDGISQAAIDSLKSNGFEVLTVNVAQEQLINYINQHKIEALLVRSATQVRTDIIDQCPSLKLIGRGGVGMDNIDVDYAEKKGLHYDSNRNMPLDGDSRFKVLKKGYAGGTELRGKTLGIIGFGKIGQATAKIALGVGMKVVYNDAELDKATISLSFYDGQDISFELNNSAKEEVLKTADFISLHVPQQRLRKWKSSFCWIRCL